MPDFVDFDRFLEYTRHASPPARPRTVLESAPAHDFAVTPRGLAEFERMRSYILETYQGVRPVHSYQGHDGHPVDCVPIDRQPSWHHLTAAERAIPITPPRFQRLTGTDRGGLARVEGIGPKTDGAAIDPFGRTRTCPEGAIPLRRITLEQLTRFDTLDQFLRKAPGNGPAPEQARVKNAARTRSEMALPEDHRYAHAFDYDVGTCVGASTWLNVWQPRAAPGVFSLSQLWITSKDDPTSSTLQTIEGGWQVYPEHYGHDQPVLFLFVTNAGYSPISGGTRGYNLEVPAFVQTSARWTIGGPLPATSVAGGPQRGFRMHWQRDPKNGHWWLFLQGSGDPEPVGFYPRSLFGSGPLSLGAARIDFGGEVAANPGVPTTGQMGSGTFAESGYGAAAFQKEIVCLTPTGPQPAQLTGQATDPGRYSVQVGRSDANWGSFLFFGGPGDP